MHFFIIIDKWLFSLIFRSALQQDRIGGPAGIAVWQNKTETK